MDFSFRDEDTQVREIARKILDDLATNEHLKDVEAADVVFDAALYRELAGANLLGSCVSEAYGGSGYDFFSLCVLLQEVGRAVAPVPVFASLALGALPVERFGSDAQKQALLPGVVEGDHILTTALVEVDAAEPLDVGTRARREGDGWRLSGSKSSVPAASLAHRILVPARTEQGEIALFLVDPSAGGVTLEDQPSADRQPYSRLTLAEAPVSESDRLGAATAGREILSWIVDRATVGLCAIQLGVAERALEMTASYGRERHQFDRPIGSFQAYHQRAGDAYIQTEAIRLTCWEAAWRLAAGLPADAEVAVAKYWAAEGGQFVAYACQHLHGGVGIDVDYPLHRYFIWSLQAEHTLGSARAQLATLGGRIARDGAGL